MNNKKLVEELLDTYLCRCNCWGMCIMKNCDHYNPHTALTYCYFFSPVKYCKVVGGFVYDAPESTLSQDYECDPNLAFRAHREAIEKSKKIDALHRHFSSNQEVEDDF